MSPGGARRGRRDNGLDAAEYAVAGDVDPRVGEHLLDVLAAGGIAAYLQPSADLNPITRTTFIPATPTDRLYVDRAHLSTARDYLAQLTDEEPAPAREAGNEPDVEAAWARIIAGYNAEVDPTLATPWPEAEDIHRPDGTQPPEPERAGNDPGTRRPSPGLIDGRHTVEPSLLDGLDTFGAHLPESDDDEGYTPPPPPPLPHISKYAVIGVLAIVAGFVLFIEPSVLPLGGNLSMVIGFVAILVGFVMLIWRLRSGDDDDIDPDMGAKV
ncbi:DUF308 domain-containing protein [Rhizomonospora bruguierae]|uniref:DUF308 domain-containing protein n=1 Tax=Rhizomonospora bruguierae TaxID=1581705 RepID=UPI001BCD455E|nr:DUF308 domain-containing protein [Micromonospora sp. NBRC 107566]